MGAELPGGSHVIDISYHDLGALLPQTAGTGKANALGCPCARNKHLQLQAVWLSFKTLDTQLPHKAKANPGDSSDSSGGKLLKSKLGYCRYSVQQVGMVLIEKMVCSVS